MSNYYEIMQVKDVCDKIARDVSGIKGVQADNSRATADAFNRMAKAIEGLTAEVRALRADLNPQNLDKPKLPAPGTDGPAS